MALMLPPNWCVIFFKDPSCVFTLEGLGEVLRSGGLSVGDPSPEGQIPVQWGSGPVLRVSVHRSAELQAVIRGLLGRRRQFDRFLEGLDSEVRIELEDVAEVLDEINTLIQVQTDLQDATRGLMYLGWNNVFAPPDKVPEA